MLGLVPVPHIHFVGIGGIGMSGLAQALLEAGYPVSGCDRQRSHITDRLAAAGATIYEGHSARHLVGTDLLVVSSAIPPDNADRLEAQRRGVPVVKRAKILGHLVANHRTIAVAGTHGKTTTTGMISWILECAGRDPTVFAGGELQNLGSNARRGNGIHAVVEADEYDRAFLELTPAYAVVTNVEADHPDVFADLPAVMEAFSQFLDRVQPGGHIIACSDSPHLLRLLTDRANVTTYGLAKRQPPAEWMAHDIRSGAGGQTFTVSRRGGPSGSSQAPAAEHDYRVRVGDFRLLLPGHHNVSNALAAIAAASFVGIDPPVIADALASFQGARRRFELKGTARAPSVSRSGPGEQRPERRGRIVPEHVVEPPVEGSDAPSPDAPTAAPVIVIDDYAHHPTEIRATLAAVRQRYGDRRVWAVFQPHTYSRTRVLLNEFALSFSQADRVIVTDIYPAREEDILGVSAEDLVDRIRHGSAQGPSHVAHIAGLPAAADYVAEHLLPGDIVLTLGAGDVWKVGDAVLKRLGQPY